MTAARPARLPDEAFRVISTSACSGQNSTLRQLCTVTFTSRRTDSFFTFLGLLQSLPRFCTTPPLFPNDDNLQRLFSHL